MPTLLWWGRSDIHYSRNRIMLNLFGKLGWKVNCFHPVSSALGKAQAFFSRPELPDLVWVPCFRQRDMRSAIHWARKWKRPLVFDPLISAYQKEVFEKNKWHPAHKSAVKLCQWESSLFQHADVVVADTRLHASFFIETFQLDPKRVKVIHVGADEKLFKPKVLAASRMPLEILFYGSFLPLHGPEVIIDAASLTTDQHVQWVLLGDGESKKQMQEKAKNLTNVRFEPWIAYQRLAQRISQAHMVLGIFGETPKARMVIPNKVFETMAVGRPLITMRSEAYPQEILDSQAIGWVPPGDPRAVAKCVERWMAAPDHLEERGAQTRRLYDEFFKSDKLLIELQNTLALALNPGI